MRVLYRSGSDPDTVVLTGDFYAPHNVVQVYYRCRSTGSASAVVSIGNTFKRGGLRCDDKVHWLRNVPVTPRSKPNATLGMYSGGSATLSIWSVR